MMNVDKKITRGLKCQKTRLPSLSLVFSYTCSLQVFLMPLSPISVPVPTAVRTAQVPPVRAIKPPMANLNFRLINTLVCLKLRLVLSTEPLGVNRNGKIGKNDAPLVSWWRIRPPGGHNLAFLLPTLSTRLLPKAALPAFFWSISVKIPNTLVQSAPPEDRKSTRL